MKKICLFLLLVMVFTFAPIVTKATSNNLKHDIIYYSANYLKDYDEVNLINEFDYSFIGKVTSLIETSQYNGNGMEIPYTFFKVNVVEVKKGDLEKEIIIKFYGGYDEENKLNLFEDMVYPKINSYYKFYCDKSIISLEDDGRTLSDSYIVSNSYNMTEIEYVEEDRLDFTSIQPSLSTYVFRPPITIVDPDDGEELTNISFDTAFSLLLDYDREVYLSAGMTRYYKYTATSLDYLTIYSTGSLDCKVSVYDSDYTLIKSNDDVLNRGLDFTNTPNFFCNFYGDINQTYYFKVEFYDAEQTGSFDMKLMKDNWITSTYDELVTGMDDVDDNNKVDYIIQSKYLIELGSAINEWNKLESVSILPDTASTVNNLKISDYYDSDTDIIGYTQINWLSSTKIKLNTFYMDSFSQEQRIHTCLHELGHVLGLNEFTSLENDNNVMHQGSLAITQLGPTDIAVYRYLWG